MVPLSRIAGSPPIDDQDSVGLPVAELLDGELGVIRLLVGERGAGKTAITKYLGAVLARQLFGGMGTAFPIFVNASELLAEPGGDAVNVLARAAAESVVGVTVTQEVMSRLLESVQYPLVVFIDGLDLVLMESDGEHTRERAITSLIRTLQASNANVRIVATCREDVWFDPDFGLRHLGESFFLRLFTPRDIALAIHRWWEIRGSHVLTPPALIAQITADRHLSRLCRLPLMLSLVLGVVERKRQLPVGVGGLCDEIARRCLDATEAQSSSQFGLSPSDFRAELEQILRALAWKTTELANNNDRQLGILATSEVRDRILNVIDKGGRTGTLRSSTAVVSYLTLFREGLDFFGEVVPDGYGFRQNAFRLYFSGHHLASATTIGVPTLSEDGPAECLRVWAEGQAHTQSIDSVLLWVEDLFELNAERSNLLAAELVAVVRRVAEETRAGWMRRWSGRALNAMVSLRETRNCALDLRMRAGDVLAELGDPLLSEESLRARYVDVPAGRAHIGKQLPPVTTDRKYQRIHWAPAFETNIGPLRVSKYPVTNFEFGRFIVAAGYETTRYWTQQGDRWRTQDGPFIDELSSIVEASFGVHYSKDVEGRFMTLLDHTNLVHEFCQTLLLRNRPLYWLDARFNHPNQPVVGINWWEASAYCSWLTEELRGSNVISESEVCTLLSEEEWEYCARGIGRSSYPWGDDWTEDSAHVRRTDGWLTRSTSIGTFPWSCSPFGLHCMVGNVWEWCSSSAREYAVGPFAEVSTNVLDRVTRGSSWLAKEPLTRDIAFRSYDPPCNAYVDLSLRVVIRLEMSE
ncbi:SUMF1/EgtB/PvdO family nonheme iron enzyme [Dermatophilaceae bacterium Soc4.6]